jgi:uncharacterized protein YndB with AHSA1/START domain
MAAQSSSAIKFTTLSDLEILEERVFDAPRELVFKTFTDPTLIPQWWGPRDSTTTVDRMDVRPGGSWRFINRGGDGTEHPFSGVYREVEPSTRLVYTFNYEPLPGNHELLETVTFEELDGKTKMVDHLRFLTVEDRDGMLQSGMEKGANETMDRMAELLARLQQGQNA